MKLKAMKSFRHGTKTYGRGAVIELPDPVAKDLIKRGFAHEEGVEPEKKPERAADAGRSKPKPAKAGAHRRDDESATAGRAAERKED